MIRFHCQDVIGAQIVDAWYAKKQICHAQTFDNISQSPLSSEPVCYDIQSDGFNIAVGHQFDDNFVDQRHLFDLVLLCNTGEPLEVSSPKLRTVLQEPNVYLIANSLLSKTHELCHKVIWFPHNIMLCKDYWTRHFFPQYFEHVQLAGLPRSKSMIYISGQNRANRDYFWRQLNQAVPMMPAHNSNYARDVDVLNDCQWESQHDQDFRQGVNELYPSAHHQPQSNYYQDSPTIGINGKFGKVAPGFFLLPLYYENRCVIFPESSWINDQLTVTEKALKCFFSGSVAWPIGGANTNLLYNQIGFKTAWNLLPADLQSYDSEPDHWQRIKGVTQAIRWAWDHPDALTGTRAQEIVQQNRERFLTNASHIDYVDRFDQVINSFCKKGMHNGDSQTETRTH